MSRNTFISSSPICRPASFLSCLTAVARTSSAGLNNSDDTGHPRLALDFRGENCEPFKKPINMMFAIDALH